MQLTLDRGPRGLLVCRARRRDGGCPPGTRSRRGTAEVLAQARERMRRAVDIPARTVRFSWFAFCGGAGGRRKSPATPVRTSANPGRFLQIAGTFEIVPPSGPIRAPIVIDRETG